MRQRDCDVIEMLYVAEKIGPVGVIKMVNDWYEEAPAWYQYYRKRFINGDDGALDDMLEYVTLDK